MDKTNRVHPIMSFLPDYVDCVDEPWSIRCRLKPLGNKVCIVMYMYMEQEKQVTELAGGSWSDASCIQSDQECNRQRLVPVSHHTCMLQGADREWLKKGDLHVHVW